MRRETIRSIRGQASGDTQELVCGQADRENPERRPGRRRAGRKWGMAAAALSLVLLVQTPALAAGWSQATENQWRYQMEDGSYVVDGLTPDGFYIDGSGLWQPTRKILDTTVACRQGFLSASGLGHMANLADMMASMLQVVEKECGSVRAATLEEQEIVYLRVSDKEEQELFRFYRDTDTDGYILRLRCNLSNTQGATPRTSWYDFQILNGILCRVSAAGAQAADAIYQSWEQGNAYGLQAGSWVRVGDAMIRYEGTDGAGLYYIRAAEGGE